MLLVENFQPINFPLRASRQTAQRHECQDEDDVLFMLLITYITDTYGNEFAPPVIIPSVAGFTAIPALRGRSNRNSFVHAGEPAP
jgi:hypothetical protein